MRAVSIVLALLALGACDSSDKHAVEKADAVGNVANYTAVVSGLSERERNPVFLRAVRDAGLPCQDVTKSEQVSGGGAGRMWRAQCEDGVAHLVQVMPDGTANVVSRTMP